MKFKGKKLLSLVLTWLVIASSLAGGLPSMNVAAASASAIAAEAQLQDDLQDGVTLHCWNWSYNNIAANMEKIASLGYTSIQTSPIQQAKEGTTGKNVGTNWWVYYQPASFSIDNTGSSALGNKAEFVNMCNVAHQYGVKVIVDVVANHMGNKTRNNLADTIISDIKNDSSCWHDITTNTTDYSNRYNITQYCMDGLPDLNTGSSKVQSYVLNFLKECIDSGVDGFRFDGAKHIETPQDSAYGCGSNFWPTVINGANSYAASKGVDLYNYGEILDKPDNNGSLPISAYTQYMSITDNETGNNLRNYVNGGNASGAGSNYYIKGTAASNLVLWAESHDTYADNKSSGVSAQNINKTWAMVAARADAMGLYFARPNSTSSKLGAADTTGWSWDEVGAVNLFHNAFVGQPENLSSEGSIAYCERGNSGVVLVNCSGTSQYVEVTAKKMVAGTYVDQVSGNTFTVANGKIKGNIGSKGYAVVYNKTAPTPSVTISKEGGTFSSDTLTLTVALKNATTGTYKVGNNNAVSFSGQTSFPIGANMAVGDSVVVTLTTDNYSQSYTFTKVEKSNNVAYIKLPSSWGSTVYCYAYDSATETIKNAVWPGVQMTSVGNGIYQYEVPENIEAPRVIFYSSVSNRYPADTLPGLLLDGSMIYADGVWSTYSEVSNGTVTANYVDESGNTLATAVTTTGQTGAAYTTSAKTISGYTLLRVDGAASGTYTSGTITVNYVYQLTLIGTDNSAYIDKPSNWGTVYCYVYSADNETTKNAAWPGVQMTNVSGSIYKYDVPSTISNPRVIFTDGTNQYPAAMQAGLTLNGKMIYQNGSWTTYTDNVVTSNVAYIRTTSSWGTSLYCYAYASANESIKNAVWPGAQMTCVAGNLYKYEVPASIASPRVIFTDGVNQYPGAMQSGLALSGAMICENSTWSSYAE